jgi:phosphohistidine phosphatase
MDLLVVRHATAFDRDPGRWPADRERPLTREGERVFARVARGLKVIAPTPKVVLASPYARCWRTAEILQDVGWPAPEPFEALEADATTRALIAALDARPPVERIALVGHRPTLQELCGILVGSAAVELKKGGAARLSVQSFVERGAVLRWLVQPKALRRLG